MSTDNSQKLYKENTKSQQKQISKRLTQLKNKYLLESFWGFDFKCSGEVMTRLRIALVKI
jgi:hypothetical protein